MKKTTTTSVTYFTLVSNVITKVNQTCQFSVIQLHTVSVIMDFDISHEQKNCFVESVHKKAQL